MSQSGSTDKRRSRKLRIWKIPHSDKRTSRDLARVITLKRVERRVSRCYGLIPATFNRIRYSPVRAVTYSVLASASPHVQFATISGIRIVPRCFPCGEMRYQRRRPVGSKEMALHSKGDRRWRAVFLPGHRRRVFRSLSLAVY
jgi:hypothetical protein